MSKALAYHKKLKGKIEVISRAKIKSRKDLQLAYTPGVAEPCLAIQKDVSKLYDYTRKGNMVAVITDGSAVLGLGNIGPEAGLPVMEGKCALFKRFADVDAFPIAIKTQNVDEFVRTVELIAPMFGGINLEDIAAPRCFEIEEKLKQKLDIPVFHDDQHGTAIVCLAGLINALKVVKKNMKDITVVVNGLGAAGVAITKLFLLAGVGEMRLLDSKGIIFDGRTEVEGMKAELAKKTNREKRSGGLAEALQGADVFIGVSKPNLVTPDMVRSMNKKSILFAMANPVPEIMPDVAKKAGAFVVATGRSDFPNQINNVLAFPGIFRGALDARVR
jgi:malate dehydrogenase (oxaloacetate-decarboxylating)